MHFAPLSALALQYMRTKNVSHMDLKPQNILLSSMENPVLKLGGNKIAYSALPPLIKLWSHNECTICYQFQRYDIYLFIPQILGLPTI